MSPAPDMVWQLLNHGWNVAYGVASITFSCYGRSIRMHDSGHVEVADARNQLAASSRHDPIWATALELLEIDLARLEFNPFLRLWAYPLGTGRNRGDGDERVRSAQ